jgi:hypothetical protein
VAPWPAPSVHPAGMTCAAGTSDMRVLELACCEGPPRHRAFARERIDRLDLARISVRGALGPLAGDSASTATASPALRNPGGFCGVRLGGEGVSTGRLVGLEEPDRRDQGGTVLLLGDGTGRAPPGVGLDGDGGLLDSPLQRLAGGLLLVQARVGLRQALPGLEEVGGERGLCGGGEDVLAVPLDCGGGPLGLDAVAEPGGDPLVVVEHAGELLDDVLMLHLLPPSRASSYFGSGDTSTVA